LHLQRVMNIKKNIGNQIKKRRKFLKITQKHLSLSELTGVSLRSLQMIENGQINTTIEQLDKILNVLGLKIKLEIKQHG